MSGGRQPRIGVVGVCASGKSTLVRGLTELGYDAFAIAQEHSGVPFLWQRKNPDFLIMLDASYETVRRRRPDLLLSSEQIDEQRQRLRHAREHAHLYLPTDDLTIEQVRRKVIEALSLL